MQVVVLGSHRSGTSLVTRLINMMGIHVANEESETIGSNEENPRGFWERKDVVECNDRILSSQNSSWYSLSNWKVDTSHHPKKQMISSIVESLDSHGSWVIKDPRLCLTLPYWRPALTNTVYVIAYRDPLEIARSLEKRNQLPFYYGIALWEYYMVNALNFTRQLPEIYVQYRDFIHTPLVALGKLYDQFKAYGVEEIIMPKEEDVLSFVTPELYRSKNTTIRLEEVLNEHQIELMHYCVGDKVIGNEPLTYSHSTQSILQHYTQTDTQITELEVTNTKLAKEHNEQHHELERLYEMITNIRTELEIAPHNYKDGYSDIFEQLDVKMKQLESLSIFRHNVEAPLDELEALLHQLEQSARWRLGNAALKPARFLSGKTFSVSFDNAYRIIAMMKGKAPS